MLSHSSVVYIIKHKSEYNQLSPLSQLKKGQKHIEVKLTEL